MTQIYLYTGLAFAAGAVVAWMLHIFLWMKFQKTQKSLQGYLESEKLIRERFQKENNLLHQLKETSQNDYEVKIQELKSIIKIMDEDILLLQKSNEQTEALLNAADPNVISLKVKLIEAQNTIARFKAQMLVK